MLIINFVKTIFILTTNSLEKALLIDLFDLKKKRDNIQKYLKDKLKKKKKKRVCVIKIS